VLVRLTRSGSAAAVEYRRADPLTGTWVQVGRRREPDPLESEAGEWNPYLSSEPPYDPLDPTGAGAFKEMGDLGDIRGSCVWNSMPVPCSVAMGELTSGRAVINPRETDSMTLARLGVFYVVDYLAFKFEEDVRVLDADNSRGHFEFMGAGATLWPQGRKAAAHKVDMGLLNRAVGECINRLYGVLYSVVLKR
jgi:hypothetical protein